MAFMEICGGQVHHRIGRAIYSGGDRDATTFVTGIRGYALLALGAALFRTMSTSRVGLGERTDICRSP